MLSIWGSFGSLISTPPMDNIPPFSEDLIKELDRMFPPIQAEEVKDTGEKALAYRAGERSVVEYLLMVLARAKQEDLES